MLELSMLKVLAMVALLNSQGYGSAKGIDPDSLYCVARAVYSEARGEPIMGQVAVAWGIRNRMSSRDFPNGACAVIYDRKHAVQFPHIDTVYIDYESVEWETAVEVAGHVTAGLVADPTGGGRFWYNPKKVSKPAWAKMAFMKRIGDHVFYDVVKKNG